MRTSVNLPAETLAAFDEVWEAEGFDSRSRAVREAVREYVERHDRLERVTGDVVAAIAFDYEHATVIGELHALQHEYQDVIRTTAHAHEGEWCLETVFCRGDAAEIRELLYRLRDFDAVGRANVMFLERVDGE
ncbi:CopG family ribbon-helix-helix protein [Candidatus Halobonum tyrrellensis]|uniref:CopG family transcriptional regulator n=1 Tax=Candidatus Halobonum tyrrellensis G22 TaxID=1324957 RepID=V4IWV0_9EURY|nr:ribbon-helix-helix protein, CopG family [Candidatus Halobonum tyrrellensis]ESP87667.1 CopG family transcriptional regulator [Candidatus Halobonum tyrrellensis G22]